jgi:hypothetical protein
MRLKAVSSQQGIDVALQFEARKVALKQDRTGFVLTLSIHPDECPEEILRDFVGARYGCALVRIQDDESATPYDNRVKKAGMLCRDPKFQEFVSTQIAGYECDESECADILCDQCGIESRTELHGNASAKEIFDRIVLRYENWRYPDDPF